MWSSVDLTLLSTVYVMSVKVFLAISVIWSATIQPDHQASVHSRTATSAGTWLQCQTCMHCEAFLSKQDTAH